MKSKQQTKSRRSSSNGSSNDSLKNRHKTDKKWKHLDQKICIGDKVKITTNKLKDAKGTVMYIGYPYPNHGIRYGIDLEKAKGDNDGSFYIDLKTGKLAKSSHIKKYHKQIKKRKFFKARKNHGMLIKKMQISEIYRPSTSDKSRRFTIEDKVIVSFRGMGIIKFIGYLEHIKQKMGIWYGIQLKERKGPHDGTVNGVKYFQCQPHYGLHCRQSHLKLDDHDDSDHNIIFNNDSMSKHRTSFQEIKFKTQKSNKWAKVLGVEGNFAGFSVRNVTAPIANPQKHQKQYTDSVDSSLQSDSEMKLNSIKSKHDSNIPSLSNILPAVPFHHTSVHVLPGLGPKQKTISHSSQHSRHDSIKRGGTIVVIPGYYEALKKRNFCDHYDFDEFEDQVGDGEFGVVYKCRRKYIDDEPSMTESKSDDDYDDDDSSDDDGKEVFAVKKIKKAKFHHLTYQNKQKNIERLQQEIKLLEKIQRLKKRHIDGSKYVIDLIDVFEDRNYLYIVTNFCSGGNLWRYIEERQKVDSEETIQRIMKQILEGLVFLHENKMAHLDLKPENIMFAENDEIQIIDFGMSRVIPPLHKVGVLCGSPNYIAPEVINGGYDKKADIWSVGVIFFMLRFGYPPFFANESSKTHKNTIHYGLSSDHEIIFEKIKRGFYPITKKGAGPWFPGGYDVSNELKDLISFMLEMDLKKRYTASQCLSHSFFKTIANPKKLPKGIMDALSKFSGQCQFKILISKLFVNQIDENEMKQLKEYWDYFDIDNDGSLTLQQFKSVMMKFDHGYKDYQIEAIFESLDWNETDRINFNSLLTAFSYQRLVAVDERLWHAFARLDVDNDGQITKKEIKKILKQVNPNGFDDGIKQLIDDKLNNNKLSAKERRDKNRSLWIGDAMDSADWDDDGEIDYEEFLHALHPIYNESVVTPKLYSNPSTSISSQIKTFKFQPSIETGIIYKKNINGKITNNHQNYYMMTDPETLDRTQSEQAEKIKKNIKPILQDSASNHD